MIKKLFIDDLRIPSDVGLNDDEWDIARNYNDAMFYCDTFKPQEISFDHDLADFSGPDGRELTGFDVARGIVEMDMDFNDYIYKDFKFHVHSKNPVGKKNIESYLNNYMVSKFGIIDTEGKLIALMGHKVDIVPNFGQTLDFVRVSKYCQPRDVKGRQWLLVFEDVDEYNQSFGDDEQSARKAYKEACVSWNCFLFCSADVKDE